MSQTSYELHQPEGGVPIKMWTRGVPVDDKARAQLARAAQMPFVFRHVAAMPDVHVGIGATVGSVIPTKGAVIPAAVGVDIGCGMMAARTSLMASDLPDNLEAIRSAIERAVPHGRAVGRGKRDTGSWGDPPQAVVDAWATLAQRFGRIAAKYPKLQKANHLVHLGTLGTGNHFIELCLDEDQRVWVMLHSGSRGIGNAIGTFFIELAKKDMRKWHINLPDQDLAYFPEGTDHFDDYVEAVGWAQDFAALNRRMMLSHVMDALRGQIAKPFEAELEAVNCHHNYVARENHFGENVLVTRKGAVRAAKGSLDHPGFDGGKKLHCARAGQCGQLRQLQPWCGPDHVTHRGQAHRHARRTHRGYRRG
ncbi:RtcB family protein [Altererythrobacter sp. KTW20L]|uniref:RtcB family protein n=1 Tax=Altererythrobacter sp. KTW20L TaxID=2942210 RepID=UPI0024BE48F0|nr:RtcB family protein [Altererythrobacter sp. KTW20L]